MSWQPSQPFAAGQRVSAGQRPLPQMMAAALMASQKGSAEAALQQLQEAMRNQLSAIPSDIDWQAFQRGVQRYAASTAPHHPRAYTTLAQLGRVSLLHAGGEGPSVVLVPSMINRGYVLDLAPGFSLVEYLKAKGFAVMLIDWGAPTQDQLALTPEALIADHLEPLIRSAATHAGAPIRLVGYCMGGLLATAAAVRLGKEVVGKLAVAAMPWDFTQTTSHAHMQGAESWLRPVLAAQNVLEPSHIAAYFWSLDPWGPIRRIMAYGTEADPARLAHLTALEDWLADGLALDGPIAEEMLLNWYGSNTPLKGQWQVCGTPITPQSLAMPLHITLTQTDVLVPLACSLPFVGQTRGATVHMAQSGHVSLVAGRRAKSQFYEPLTAWLQG